MQEKPLKFIGQSFLKQIITTVDGSEILHQLRLVVYPIIHVGFNDHPRWFSRRISGCHQQYQSCRWFVFTLPVI